MKILFYILAIGAAAFGFMGLFRAVEYSLNGNGFEFVQICVGAIGFMLAMFWIKRARAVNG
jgi:hypothetical protein